MRVRQPSREMRSRGLQHFLLGAGRAPGYSLDVQSGEDFLAGLRLDLPPALGGFQTLPLRTTGLVVTFPRVRQRGPKRIRQLRREHRHRVRWVEQAPVGDDSLRSGVSRPPRHPGHRHAGRGPASAGTRADAPRQACPPSSTRRGLRQAGRAGRAPPTTARCRQATEDPTDSGYRDARGAAHHRPRPAPARRAGSATGRPPRPSSFGLQSTPAV